MRASNPAARPAAAATTRGLALRNAFMVESGDQLDLEPGTAAGGIGSADLSTLGPRQAGGEGQSQPGLVRTGSCFIGTEERIEEMRHMVFRNARARVLDPERNGAFV